MVVTRKSLLLIAAGVLGVSFGLAALFAATGIGLGAVERARWLATTRSPADAEDLLVRHVERHPDDEDAWRELVKLRGLGLRPLPELAGGAVPGSEAELFTALQRLSRAYEPTLDEDAFLALLGRAQGMPPGLLEAWYAFWREGSPEAFRVPAGELDALWSLEQGRVFLAAGEGEKALAAFERTLSRSPDDKDARDGVLTALALLGRDAEVARKLDDPTWRAAASHRQLASYWLERGRPLEMTWHVNVSQIERRDVFVWGATLLAGLAWIVFLLLLGGGRSFTRPEKVAAALALPLGVLSAALTLGAAVLLDHSLGSVERRDETFLLAYFVLGVGLKEELIKALCFVPLIPLLLRSKSERAVLIVASLVGLGFAIEENADYFVGGGAVVLGRFLTANFLHLTLTGLIGHALVRALQKGGEAWNDFTTTFLKMVAIHGLYDFLIMSQMLGGLSYFAITLFLVIAQQYLRVVLMLPRPGGRPRYSLTKAFTAALTVAFGANFILLSTRFGLGAASEQMYLGLLGNGLIALLFYRELDERIV